MSALDPVEATRREFEAVMRQGRFATIEQLAADLRSRVGDEVGPGDIDLTDGPRAPIAPPAGQAPALPTRTPR